MSANSSSRSRIPTNIRRNTERLVFNLPNPAALKLVTVSMLANVGNEPRDPRPGRVLFSWGNYEDTNFRMGGNAVSRQCGNRVNNLAVKTVAVTLKGENMIQVIDGFIILHLKGEPIKREVIIKGNAVQAALPLPDNDGTTVLVGMGREFNVTEEYNEIMGAVTRSYKQVLR